MLIPEYPSAPNESKCYICKYNMYCSDAIKGAICRDFNQVSKQYADEKFAMLTANKKRIEYLNDPHADDKRDTYWGNIKGRGEIK